MDMEQTWGSGDELGWVSYFHAKGIDRPLTITKYGQGTVVPHQNWRGQYSLGTFQHGQRSDYAYRNRGFPCALIPSHTTTLSF